MRAGAACVNISRTGGADDLSPCELGQEHSATAYTRKPCAAVGCFDVRKFTIRELRSKPPHPSARAWAPPRFSLPRFGFVVAAVEIGERLPVGVSDDITARHWVGVLGRRKAAGCSAMAVAYPMTPWSTTASA
jgi:hypothetical protein